MTNPDYRALCAELVEALHEHTCLYEGHESELVARARALLAQPVAKRPTVMEIIELHTWLEDEWRANNDGEDLPMVDYARGVLAKWGHPTPQPVAVSERLPGPEDCDEQGRCWMCGKVGGDWRLISTINSGIRRLTYCFSHWLPANALPTPEALDD